MPADCEYDVVVVGLGPTGATLANLLAQSDIRVLVIERESNIYDLPRAVHFDDETMRVFQTTGVAEALSEKIRVNPGMRFIDDTGRLLLDWPRPQSITSQGWHASYRLHQPDLERLLRNVLSQYTCCDVRTQSTLTDVTQKNDHVQLTYEHNQHAIDVTAQYVVGCDGANSSVRQHMNTTMHDLGFRQRWLVVDILLKQEIPGLGDHTIQFCMKDQPMTYCRNPGLRRRWEMRLSADITDDEATNETRIWKQLSHWITPDVATIERKAVYTFRSAVAQKWRNNRLLIAGDAAHLTPPFMGQGMCAGIRDAANLAWKLSAACNHTPNSDSLLDTYQSERDQHVREYISTAVQLGELISSVNSESAPASANTNEQSGNNTQTTMASPAPGIGHAFNHWLQSTPALCSGMLFPQPRLSDNQLLDDVTGYEFTLLTRYADLSTHLPVINALDHPELLECLQTLDATTVLMRPDRYIACTAVSREQTDALCKLADKLVTSNQPR